MNISSSPKVALALITRHLNDADLVLRFLDNAESFGHQVDRVIAAISHGLDPSAVETIEQHVRLDVLQASGDRGLRDRLRAGGLERDAVDGLLQVPSWAAHRQAPYSAYRNAVLLHALIEGLDAVIFFDTDVYPKVLTGVEDGVAQFREVDFVGAHLGSMAKEGVVATTSEYSGYYIVPPMAFDGLEQLLLGMRKGKALSFVRDSHRHQCLNLGSPGPRRPRPTRKPLGGNLGLALAHPENLSLFYSTTYVFQGECILGRGEDTLLGRAISRSSRRIVDVDLAVFHDTYPGFPAVPDMCQAEIRTRFYHACLGWIGRNPFLTWFLDQAGELDMSLDQAISVQRAGLEVGGRKAAQAFNDSRFAALDQAFEASLNELPAAIRRYERLMEGWAAFLEAFTPRYRHDDPSAQPQDTPLFAPENEWADPTNSHGEPFVRSSPVV